MPLHFIQRFALGAVAFHTAVGSAALQGHCGHAGAAEKIVAGEDLLRAVQLQYVFFDEWLVKAL